MIDAIVTHERPHFDEYLAIFLLKKFGENKFPGISAAKVVYLSSGGGIPDGRSADDCEKEGKLLIGVGGGRFDEHPAADKNRKQDECAATLVAKALGVADDLSLEKLLKFAVNNDLKAAAHPFDLAYIAKVMHQQYPPEKVMDWIMIGLEAKYQEQVSFFTEAGKEFERRAKIEEVLGPRGMILRMATIVSDDEQINKFARSAYGGKTAIVIQKRLSGNVQIFVNQQRGLTLYDVARILRLTEQKIKGKVVVSDWKMLASEGKVAGAGEWFFFQAAQMLLNGSLTASGVPATKIPFEQIQEIVRIGINPNAFEANFASRCKKGICASIIKGSACSWYKFGLQRCRKIRFEMRKP